MDDVRIIIMTAESERELIAFNRLCFPTDYWREEDWHELLSDPRAVYYALMDGEELIGNAFIYNWQGEHDYVKIMNLSVAPGHRGKGYAHLLLNHVRDEMTALGMRKFRAETRETNNAMQKVFDDCGYVRSGFEADCFKNPPGNAYKYSLDL